MELKDIIKNYKEVAAYLEDGQAAGLLDIFESAADNQEYLLPFIGQFSAGKSKLINNILDREILPTKITESTAFLTYIVYSESDCATIKYTDGEERSIPFDQIKELYQNNLQGSKPIAALYVGINCEILKSGLKIVDTPGLNTLITEHVKITEELLYSSLYVVYVLGSSPQQTDIEIIKHLANLNIRMAFVRNKADLINTDDEDFATTIGKDKDSIKQALQCDDVRFFVMNNDSATKDETQWRECRERFVNFIKDKISSDVAAVYQESILSRLQQKKDKFLAELSQKEVMIRHSANLSLDELTDKQRKIQLTIDNLNNTIEKNKKNLAQKCENRGETIESRIKTAVNNEAEHFDSEVVKLPKSGNYIQTVSDLSQSQLPQSFGNIGKVVSEEITKLSQETALDLKKDVANILTDMRNIKVEINCDFDLSTLEKINEDYSLMEGELMSKIEDYENLKKINAADIEELDAHKSELQKIISQYDSEISKVKAELEKTQSSHKLAYIDRPSEWKTNLENVGKALDVATMFIPAKGWAKIAKKAGDWAVQAGKIKNLGTIGKRISDLTENIEQGAKEKVRDLDPEMYKNEFEETEKDSKKDTKKDKSNIFDYLNISHWLGKLGETIDPPSKEIDIEAEKQFQIRCHNIQQTIDDKYNEKLQTLRKMTASENESERKRKENELMQRKQKDLEKEIETLRQECEANKKEKGFSEIKRQASDKYRSALKEYEEIITARSKTELRNIGEKIIFAVNRIIVEQLEAADKQLAEIIANRENNVKNKEEKLAEISKFKEKLQTA